MVFASDSVVRKESALEGMRETLEITLLAAPDAKRLEPTG